MADQPPRLGDVVLYTLTAGDAKAINTRRAECRQAAEDQPILAPAGNPVAAGEVYPAIVVRVLGPAGVNLQLLLDGNDSHWVTGTARGSAPGTWTLKAGA